MYVVGVDHMNFGTVLDLVQTASSPLSRDVYEESVDKLLRLIDVPTFVAHVTVGRVQINGEAVMMDGKEVKGVIADRIISTLHAGLDVAPIARFLERVSTNSQISARDEIYLFLETGHLPFTKDGCCLAYKYVTKDLKSCHASPDGTHMDHSVGSTPSLPREECDPDRTVTCAKGLHFCSHQYLSTIERNSERCVVVKVAPEDVVAIPYDYNNTKGRAWRYTVVQEIQFEDAATRYAMTPVVEQEGVYDDRWDSPAFVEEEDQYYAPDYYQEDIDGENEEDFSTFDAPSPAVAVDTTAATTDADLPRFKTGKWKRKLLSLTQLRTYVADFGQRGAAKFLSVPRSTLQSWLKT